jgi:hypothetical protein
MASTVVATGQTQLLVDLSRRYGGKPGDGLDGGHGTGLGLLGDLGRGYGGGPGDGLGDLGHGYDSLTRRGAPQSGGVLGCSVSA